MEQSNHTPLYYQLREYLVREINEGRFKPGDLLPSEPELMEKFNVSRGTVRKAYDALVHQGLVARKSGKGSFVAEPEEKAPALKVGVIVSSTRMFEEKYNPTNWELGVDKLNGIFQAASKNNIQIELLHYSPDILSIAHYDGFIVMGGFDDLSEQVIDNKLHNVVFMVEASDRNIPAGVEFNLGHCFLEAADFLVSQISGRIGYIGSKGDTRFGNFLKALKSHNREFDPELYQDALIGTVEDGYQAAEKLFCRSSNIDAVFCTTDLRALGVMTYLHEKGVSIPEEISVMGFDNLRQSALSNPPLTTYETPRSQCGRDAVSLLLKRIKDGKYKHKIITEKGKVVIRQSVQIKNKKTNHKEYSLS